MQTHQRHAAAIAVAAAITGTSAAFYYSSLGLALAHYDARAHLVVARRILDSLTPGWQQIGAVWLPLPHVLNMVPVQIDAWYRTGASGIAISVLAMAAGAGALASLLLRLTGSLASAIAGAVLLLANPNVLYLQSTPMTEPLLFGLSLLAVATTASWLDRFDPGSAPPPTTIPGMALVAVCLTRYEAWAITGAMLALAVAVLARRNTPLSLTLPAVLRLAMWPAVAIAVFSMNSRWVVGEWFVSGGFFVAENVDAIGHPLIAWRQVREGLADLSAPVVILSGYAGTALIVWAYVRSAHRASLLLLIALFAAAALPIAAYAEGHPVRIRYALPLVVACAATASAGIGVLWKPLQWLAAAAVVVITLLQARPIDHNAPLVLESQRETTNMIGRRAITTYLQRHYDGTGIMMSMGSLGHYMHDLSLAGFDLREFLHEGNGEIWRFAMLQPRHHAGWLIIEGSAEGGDALHHASLRDRWLDGFEKVAEGGGARLYRAIAR